MNKLIEINTKEEFDEQLNLPNRVFVVVLGNTADHKVLAETAESMSDNWRYTLWAKTPEILYPRLLSLALRPGVLPILSPFPKSILALSISVNNYICRTISTAQGNVVAPAFIVAETYMQP